MKITISGTGCCLIDYIYANVDFNSENFTKHMSRIDADGGIYPGKLVFSEDLERFAGKAFPKVLEEIVSDKSPDSVNLGGPAVVALLHAAQLLGSEYRVSFHGMVSQDKAGKAVIDFLSQTPLPLEYLKVISTSNPTASTVVLSDPSYNMGKGERTFINTVGASKLFTPKDLHDDFFKADIVFFGGTALVPDLHDNLTYLLRRAKEQGAMTIVGTVYDFRNEKRSPDMPWPLGEEKSYPLIDLLVTDIEEARRLSGIANNAMGNSAMEASEVFKQNGLKACIITQGAESIHCYSQKHNEELLWENLEDISMPVSAWVVMDLEKHPEKRGDTTGCGDNFVGGVIASIAEQMADFKAGKRTSYDLKQACAMGVASGGFALYYNGGAYFEKYPGEKRKYISQISKKYAKQISENLKV